MTQTSEAVSHQEDCGSTEQQQQGQGQQQGGPPALSPGASPFFSPAAPLMDELELVLVTANSFRCICMGACMGWGYMHCAAAAAQARTHSATDAYVHVHYSSCFQTQPTPMRVWLSCTSACPAALTPGSLQTPPGAAPSRPWATGCFTSQGPSPPSTSTHTSSSGMHTTALVTGLSVGLHP